LNLQMIVLGGGVMAAGDMLMKPLMDFVRHHAISASFEDCRIVQSKLWPETGVIGAAMLARDRGMTMLRNA
jgi:glucokinase